MTSVSAGHIILTPTQPVGSGRPQRESNPGPPHQKSRALATELPRPQTKVGTVTFANFYNSIFLEGRYMENCTVDRENLPI